MILSLARWSSGMEAKWNELSEDDGRSACSRVSVTTCVAENKVLPTDTAITELCLQLLQLMQQSLVGNLGVSSDVVALHLPTEPFKIRAGLEPVPRY